MADHDEILRLHERIASLTSILGDHQAFLIAVIEYLKSDPVFDLAKFASMYQQAQQKKNSTLPKREGLSDPDLELRLQAFLKQFEGPPQ